MSDAQDPQLSPEELSVPIERACIFPLPYEPCADPTIGAPAIDAEAEEFHARWWPGEAMPDSSYSFRKPR